MFELRTTRQTFNDAVFSSNLENISRTQIFPQIPFFRLTKLLFFILQTSRGSASLWSADRDIIFVSKLSHRRCEPLNPLGENRFSALECRSLCGEPRFLSRNSVQIIEQRRLNLKFGSRFWKKFAKILDCKTWIFWIPETRRCDQMSGLKYKSSEFSSFSLRSWTSVVMTQRFYDYIRHLNFSTDACRCN